ncbi:hypothetical protein HK405_014166, partial [Cladochytrium tenue]
HSFSAPSARLLTPPSPPTPCWPLAHTLRLPSLLLLRHQLPATRRPAVWLPLRLQPPHQPHCRPYRLVARSAVVQPQLALSPPGSECHSTARAYVEEFYQDIVADHLVVPLHAAMDRLVTAAAGYVELPAVPELATSRSEGERSQLGGNEAAGGNLSDAVSARQATWQA